MGPKLLTFPAEDKQIEPWRRPLLAQCLKNDLVSDDRTAKPVLPS